MPIYLAADALGGGINLVTRHPAANFAELSYELASFKTRRSTANLYFGDAKKTALYGGLNVSFNYSKNNFWVDALFTDRETGAPFNKKVHRFHDMTRSIYNEAYIRCERSALG